MGFALNSEVQTVQVTPGTTTTVEFSDYPQYAPIEILLRKIAQKEHVEETPFYGSLEHAEFSRFVFMPACGKRIWIQNSWGKSR